MRGTVADPVAFSEADCDFHAIILRACHNTVLQQLDEALAAALRITRIWITGRAIEEFGPKTLASRITSHVEVADAIRRRDRDAAQKAMQRLISQASRDLDHRLRQLKRVRPPSDES
jgi:DNA-binding FadR family transcriptional regulator